MAEYSLPGFDLLGLIKFNNSPPPPTLPGEGMELPYIVDGRAGRQF